MNVTRFRREHEPTVLALQTAIDPVVGPLLWKEPRDARLVTHTERPDFVRVGPAIGDGVALSTINPGAVLSTFNDIAAKHGLNPADAVQAVDGEYACTADNQIGTTLELRIGHDVRIWVDDEALIP